MKYNKKECEKVYYQVLADWSRGVGFPPDGDIPNAPEGYREFLQDHPELRVKFGHKEEQQIECWNDDCKNLYSIRLTHCPKCGKFNSKRSSIR